MDSFGGKIPLRAKSARSGAPSINMVASNSGKIPSHLQRMLGQPGEWAGHLNRRSSDFQFLVEYLTLYASQHLGVLARGRSDLCQHSSGIRSGHVFIN